MRFLNNKSRKIFSILLLLLVCPINKSMCKSITKNKKQKIDSKIKEISKQLLESKKLNKEITQKLSSQLKKFKQVDETKDLTQRLNKIEDKVTSQLAETKEMAKTIDAKISNKLLSQLDEKITATENRIKEYIGKKIDELIESKKTKIKKESTQKDPVVNELTKKLVNHKIKKEVNKQLTALKSKRLHKYQELLAIKKREKRKKLLQKILEESLEEDEEE